MSRIGRKPIQIPAGVDFKLEEGNLVTVKGPKGTLSQAFRPEIVIKKDGDTVVVERTS